MLFALTEQAIEGGGERGIGDQIITLNEKRL